MGIAQPTENSSTSESKSLIKFNEQDLSLTERVNALSGENLNLCLQCRMCRNGCPFSEAMDYPPHAVFRLLQYGLIKEAMECSTIWICVACNTCSVQCPMAIDIPELMDAVRLQALEEGADVAEPKILEFHRTVMDSIERYGRTHKLEIKVFDHAGNANVADMFAAFWNFFGGGEPNYSAKNMKCFSYSI